MSKKYMVVAVDADGTLLEYDEWKGLGHFGKPIKGAVEAMSSLREAGYKIVIFTTRGEDVLELERHLNKYGITFDEINQNVPGMPENISDKKVLADVYVDDRAIHFDGNWGGMVERIKSFQSWYKRDNKRPSLNLQIAGYHVDQMSLYVEDVISTMESYAHFGHNQWVIDIVDAYDEAADKYFTVKLAFNYTIMPIEFELLQVLSGKTVQVPYRDIITPVGYHCGLSHYGFHVDSMTDAVVAFKKEGYSVLSSVKTLHHSKCPHKYRYVFLDTSRLGFISKLIKRV